MTSNQTEAVSPAAPSHRLFQNLTKKPPQTAERVAVIVNLSGHRVPNSGIEWLRAQGYTRYSMFAVPIEFDYEGDVWQQCENIVANLSEARDREGRTVFQCEGTLFMCAPARGAGAIMLYEAVSSLFGIAPQLMLVSQDTYARQYALKQVIDMRAYAAKFRSFFRGKYLLGCDSGRLDDKLGRSR